MLTIEQVKENLETQDYYLDMEILCNYLINWNIDPIYEDEQEIVYFDEFAVSKLSEGIDLKKQGNNDKYIREYLNKDLQDISQGITPIDHSGSYPQGNSSASNSLAVDVATNTFDLLAKSLSDKISKNVADQLVQSDVFESVISTGKLQRDNEFLAAQVDKLINENKKLIMKVKGLERECASYKQVMGSFYVKK